MAFTRFHDDPCRIMKALQESTDQGLYYLNQPGNGEAPPYMADPYIRLQGWGANRHHNMVDLESTLRGVNRKLSRDCSTSTLANAPISYPSDQSNITEQPRAVQPAWQLRDAEVNRILKVYDPVNEHLPFQHAMNTREAARLAFRP